MTEEQPKSIVLDWTEILVWKFDPHPQSSDRISKAVIAGFKSLMQTDEMREFFNG